ncbi:TetR/AcrR family transcriptional regulator [Diaminobutyricimonas sp. TR449]|uniref:TetR/AcrR family transcriptional regulator n=1 Tax=Diaminobutyricimonas sp. TR449 TaxID=2708076 RepID=UPI001421ED51|nr:TetR/AcrR family transcriptional regulator [Diaminobutyricimonas sp. TR449]
MAGNDSSAAQSSVDATAAAIHLLAERGYDATPVDELADALEVSRSTFFRRFGTKEDIVFADHTFLLDRLGDVMTSVRGDAFDAVNKACLTVLEYHLSRPEATLERRELLRSNPSLRERELVMSHRYERVFRAHLSAHLADEFAREWVASAYAASAVAVHNDSLRAWFENSGIDAPRRLQTDLSELAQSFRQSSGPGQRSRSRVVLTAYETDAPIETVMAKIRQAVEG